VEEVLILKCILIILGPLVRIKQSLTRLRQEVQQMEVRIGVVSTPVYNFITAVLTNSSQWWYSSHPG
jgi:hypothetical protein